MRLDRHRATIREAAWILLLGSVLGFGYTAITGKGLFAPPAPAEPAAAAHPPDYMDLAELLSFYEAGNLIVVDARHDFDYELGHIRGAVNIPLKEYEEKREMTRDWPKDALIVTYCDGQECNSSIELATKFAESGFTNVRFFFGGWSEWVGAGGPTEKLRDE